MSECCNPKDMPAIPAREYRAPLEVTHAIRLRNGYLFPVCPRCKLSLDREYQNYCDRCGQCLGWRNFGKAIIEFGCAAP